MRRIQDCIFGIYNRGTTCTHKLIGTRVRKKNFIIVINFYQNNWSAIDFEIECILLLLEKGKRVKIDGAKFEKKKIKNK